ncbi:MAG: hypothetical protein ACLQGP_38270 [Isosphaeraceae bacterium]
MSKLVDVLAESEPLPAVGSRLTVNASPTISAAPEVVVTVKLARRQLERLRVA